jgi:hypothetical protein
MPRIFSSPPSQIVASDSHSHPSDSPSDSTSTRTLSSPSLHCSHLNDNNRYGINNIDACHTPSQSHHIKLNVDKTTIINTSLKRRRNGTLHGIAMSLMRSPLESLTHSKLNIHCKTHCEHFDSVDMSVSDTLNTNSTRSTAYNDESDGVTCNNLTVTSSTQSDNDHIILINPPTLISAASRNSHNIIKSDHIRGDTVAAVIPILQVSHQNHITQSVDSRTLIDSIFPCLTMTVTGASTPNRYKSESHIVSTNKLNAPPPDHESDGTNGYCDNNSNATDHLNLIDSVPSTTVSETQFHHIATPIRNTFINVMMDDRHSKIKSDSTLIGDSKRKSKRSRKPRLSIKKSISVHSPEAHGDPLAGRPPELDSDSEAERLQQRTSTRKKRARRENIKAPSAYPTLDHIKDPMELFHPETALLYEDQRSMANKSPDAFIYDIVGKSTDADRKTDTKIDEESVEIGAAELLLFCANITDIPQSATTTTTTTNHNNNNDCSNNNNQLNNNITNNNDLIIESDNSDNNADSEIWNNLIKDDRLLRAFHFPLQYYRYLWPFHLIIKETGEGKKGAGLFTAEVILIIHHA